MSATESDISELLAANIDQLIADDFKPSGVFGGPREVTIARVAVAGGKPKKGEQPMTIHLEGGLLPFRPCLTVRRILAESWGKDARQWKGRRMTLYRDPTVRSPDGTKDAGGIRVSHLSHIPGTLRIRATATRGTKAEWVIEQLAMARVMEAIDLADVLAPATVADLDRYRESEGKPAVAVDERGKIAAFLAGNPKALEKIRAWVAANPAPVADQQGN